MASYPILLCDDHVIFRQGLKKIMEGVGDLEVVGEAGDGVELLRMMRAAAPDMVILDISLPKLRGIEAAVEIKMLYQEVKLLILTMHRSTRYLHHALAAGVNGYLLKEDAPKEIFTAIDTIRKGKVFISPLLTEELNEEMAMAYRTGQFTVPVEPLSVREREVLQLIAEEKTNKEIADLLCISFKTVQHHRAAIKRKLNIRKTAGLVKYAIRKGYVSPLP